MSNCRGLESCGGRAYECGGNDESRLRLRAVHDKCKRKYNWYWRGGCFGDGGDRVRRQAQGTVRGRLVRSAPCCKFTVEVNRLHGPEGGNHQYEEERRPSLERRAIELAFLFHSGKTDELNNTDELTQV